MAIKDRREREKLERRRTILSAAADLFWDKGYEATMDEIAEKAELSKPTLYLYFRNKDDLYASIAIEGFDALKEEFTKIAGSDDSVEDKIRAIFTSFTSYVTEHRQIARITEFVLSEKGSRKLSKEVSEKVNSDISGLLSRAASVIGEGVEEGVLAAGLDPQVTAIVLWRAILGVMSLALEDGIPGRGRDFYDELFTSTMAILTDGIRKR
jgi:AcrR family transcriptional regulator